MKYSVLIALLSIPLLGLAQRSVEYNLEKPNKPADVHIYSQHGAMVVKAWDEPMVKIVMSSDVAYTIKSDKNEVNFRVSENEAVALTVYVPTNTNLLAKSFQSGAIQIWGINGNLEVDSYNGAVSAENISGTAVISAWNGAISATFKEVGDSPMAFTSYNGAISLVLPETTNASVRASVLNGNFYSAFHDPEEEMEKETEETENGRQSWYVTDLGNGGAEWRIKSLNGAVSITKW